MKDTRLREDMSTDRTGQKDLEKLYWERELILGVGETPALLTRIGHY